MSKEQKFVAHDCRNCRNGSCNTRWIDVDLTNSKSQIPTWKYCIECCKRLGIDFYSQKPSDYMSELQKSSLETLKTLKAYTFRKNYKKKDQGYADK